MRRVLFILLAIISFRKLNAQEINLRKLTLSERENYIVQKATEALDIYLHDYLKKTIDLIIEPPTYVPSGLGIAEFRYDAIEKVDNFNEVYHEMVNDYIMTLNDYTYRIYFSESIQDIYTPMYYVVLLNNGKVLYMGKMNTTMGVVVYDKPAP